MSPKNKKEKISYDIEAWYNYFLFSSWESGWNKKEKKMREESSSPILKRREK